MRSTHARALAILAAAILAAAPTSVRAAQEEPDSIRLANGKTQSAKIQTEDYKGLTIALEKGTSQLNWKDVKSIQYAQAAELTRGTDALASGDFDGAVEAFTAAADVEKQRQPIKQSAIFGIALAKHRKGDLDGAATAYKDVLHEYPKGRFALSAVRGLVSIGLATGKTDAVQKSIDDGIAAAKGAGMEAGSIAEMSIVASRLKEDPQTAARTRESYATAEKSPGVSPDAVQLARIGQARCLAVEQKGKEAEAILKQVVTSDSSPAVLASAWNALGSVAMDEGKTKRDSNRLYEALFAFLRGAVQYVPAGIDPTDEHERAIAGASKCFKFISEIESKADKKKLYAERSREKADQLRRLYPHSAHMDTASAAAPPKAGSK